MPISQEKIDRINELAKKAKSSEGLTQLEMEERQKLREEYISSFRGNLESQLKNIRIVNSDGSISPVVKKSKKKRLH